MGTYIIEANAAGDITGGLRSPVAELSNVWNCGTEVLDYGVCCITHSQWIIQPSLTGLQQLLTQVSVLQCTLMPPTPMVRAHSLTHRHTNMQRPLIKEV